MLAGAKKVIILIIIIRIIVNIIIIIIIIIILIIIIIITKIIIYAFENTEIDAWNTLPDDLVLASTMMLEKTSRIAMHA